MLCCRSRLAVGGWVKRDATSWVAANGCAVVIWKSVSTFMKSNRTHLIFPPSMWQIDQKNLKRGKMFKAIGQKPNSSYTVYKLECSLFIHLSQYNGHFMRLQCSKQGKMTSTSNKSDLKWQRRDSLAGVTQLRLSTYFAFRIWSLFRINHSIFL